MPGGKRAVGTDYIPGYGRARSYHDHDDVKKYTPARVIKFRHAQQDEAEDRKVNVAKLVCYMAILTAVVMLFYRFITLSGKNNEIYTLQTEIAELNDNYDAMQRDYNSKWANKDRIKDEANKMQMIIPSEETNKIITVLVPDAE